MWKIYIFLQECSIYRDPYREWKRGPTRGKYKESISYNCTEYIIKESNPYILWISSLVSSVGARVLASIAKVSMLQSLSPSGAFGALDVELQKNLNRPGAEAEPQKRSWLAKI